MTDRIRVLTVCLEQDYRSDDCADIISAIKMVRGVSDVEAHVADHALWAAMSAARRELGDKLFQVLYPEGKPR